MVSVLTDGLHVFYNDDVYLYINAPSVISSLKDVDVINLVSYTVLS